MTTITDQLDAMFQKMMSVADERTNAYREELDKTPEHGPCPQCAAPGCVLDFSESLEQSVARDRLVTVYGICPTCEQKAREFEALARIGVPRRVCHATLENFETPQPEQAAALAKVRAWLADRSKLNLLLLGTCGAGKGHLAAAALKSLNLAAKWTSHDAIVGGCHAADFKDRPAFLRTFQRVPVLVIDEMGAKSMTTDTPEIFYQILDRRYDSGLITILIGNIPYRSKVEGKPSILALTGEARTESRFFTGTDVIACRWDDYRKTASFAKENVRAV